MFNFKIINEIKEVWEISTSLNKYENKFGIIKNNIDSTFKTFFQILKLLFKIIIPLFIIWFLIGTIYYFYLKINFTMEMNIFINLKKTNYLDSILKIEVIDIVFEILALIDNILSIISQTLLNNELKSISYSHLNSFWNIFINPLVLLVDGTFYILVGLTGIPLIKKLIFGFSSSETLWNLPKFYWYCFLISFCIIVFFIFYQLLAISANGNNEKNKMNKTKNITFGIVLVFSSIIFIPLLFWLINYLIIFISNLLLNNIHIDQSFILSKKIFDLSFVDFNNKSNLISSVPSSPYLFDMILSPEVFYHLLFFSGLLIVFYFEIKLLIFILTRAFNILYLLISSPIVNSFFIYDGGEKFNIWIKKLVSEFFSITLIIFAFIIFNFSSYIILISLKPIQDLFITNNLVLYAKLLNYLLFMILIIVFFKSIPKLKQLIEYLFFNIDQKIDGKLETEKTNNNLVGSLNEKIEINNISNTINSEYKTLNKNINKNIKTQKERASQMKIIENKITRINKKLNYKNNLNN